jgi:hypothetical protein
LLEILTSYGLQSEEKWLREMEVFNVEDFECLNENGIKGRNPEVKDLFAKIIVSISHK